MAENEQGPHRTRTPHTHTAHARCDVYRACAAVAPLHFDAAVFTNLNIAIENLELSTNGGDAKVPYTKLEIAVGAFDNPAHGSTRGAGCGSLRTQENALQTKVIAP